MIQWNESANCKIGTGTVEVSGGTLSINGGYNGLADRQRRTLQYAKEMGIDTSLIKLEA